MNINYDSKNNETIYYSHPHGGKPFACGFPTRLDAVEFAEEYAFPDAGNDWLNIYTEEEFEAWCADNNIKDKPDNKVYPKAERKALAVYVDKVRSVFAAGHEKTLVVSSGDETVLPYSHQAYEDAVIEQANQAEYVELLARSDYEHYESTRKDLARQQGHDPKYGCCYSAMKAIREEAKCLGWVSVLNQNQECLEKYRAEGGWLWAVEFSAQCDSPAFVAFQTGQIIPKGNEGATILFDGPADWGECFSAECREEFLDAIEMVTQTTDDGLPCSPPRMALVDSFADHLPRLP